MLRLLIPSKHNQIAFVSTPDLTDNALALFERLVKSPYSNRYQLVWLVENEGASNRMLHRLFPDAPLDNVISITKNSVRGFWSFLRSRYVFATHGIFSFAQSGFHQTICNLWHGMPVKTIGAHDGKKKSDLMFMHYTIASSTFFADILSEAFFLRRDHVLVTGLPRNEWLFREDHMYQVFKEGRSKLVVWLPTYRQSNLGAVRVDSAPDSPDPLGIESLVELDRLLEGADTMLILKLHVMDLKNSCAWPLFRNIRVHTEPDFSRKDLNLYKLLACSDALVTDFSSVAIDYMLLDRPIGLFAPDTPSYTRGFTPGVWERVKESCHGLASVEDLAKFARHLPEAQDGARNLLCQMDLCSPAESILRAFRLNV